MECAAGRSALRGLGGLELADLLRVASKSCVFVGCNAFAPFRAGGNHECVLPRFRNGARTAERFRAAERLVQVGANRVLTYAVVAVLAQKEPDGFSSPALLPVRTAMFVGSVPPNLSFTSIAT